MPLRDEVYRLIAIAKGDVPTSAKQRDQAQTDYRALIDQWTLQLQQHHPGDLSITHESIQAAVETAYREYRRTKNRVAKGRLLQRDDC